MNKSISHLLTPLSCQQQQMWPHLSYQCLKLVMIPVWVICRHKIVIITQQFCSYCRGEITRMNIKCWSFLDCPQPARLFWNDRFWWHQRFWLIICIERRMLLKANWGQFDGIHSGWRNVQSFHSWKSSVAQTLSFADSTQTVSCFQQKLSLIYPHVSHPGVWQCFFFWEISVRFFIAGEMEVFLMSFQGKLWIHTF